MKKIFSLLFVASFLIVVTMPVMAEGDPMPPPHRPPPHCIYQGGGAIR